MTSRYRSTTDPFTDSLNEGAPFSLLALLKFRVGEGRVIARPGSPSRVYSGASNNVVVVSLIDRGFAPLAARCLTLRAARSVQGR